MHIGVLRACMHFLHACLYEDVKSPGVTVVNCWQNSYTGFLTCDKRTIMVGKAK